MSAAKCFTFYSYKGGSGRSVTTVNTIRHMISEMDLSPEHPILLVDADLESAGLTYFFNCEDKFTNIFRDSIHTTKLLSEVSDTLEGASGKTVFGKSSDVKSLKSQQVIEEIKKLYGNKLNEDLIDAIFSDIQLSLAEFSIFCHIVECYARQEEIGKERMESNLPKYAEITETYKLRRLLDNLNSVQKTNETQERKLEKKLRIFHDFLPASHFADISDYFDCEPNTVKFLGADVKYQGEQILRNDATNAIFKLLDMCADNGYKAVVFDSGAGVQSTAHVLHTVSDVIVYCMRPTKQFIDGTRNQLYNYLETLKAVQGQKNTDNQKTVILLPTAVPACEDEDMLCKDSFNQIGRIANAYSEIIDNTFCKPESALNEVGVFKWKEMILGTKVPESMQKEIQEALSIYTSPGTMPADAKKAYNTYLELAKRIIVNS